MKYPVWELSQKTTALMGVSGSLSGSTSPAISTCIFSSDSESAMLSSNDRTTIVGSCKPTKLSLVDYRSIHWRVTCSTLHSASPRSTETWHCLRRWANCHVTTQYLPVFYVAAWRPISSAVDYIDFWTIGAITVTYLLVKCLAVSRKSLSLLKFEISVQKSQWFGCTPNSVYLPINFCHGWSGRISRSYSFLSTRLSKIMRFVFLHLCAGYPKMLSQNFYKTPDHLHQ